MIEPTAAPLPHEAPAPAPVARSSIAPKRLGMLPTRSEYALTSMAEAPSRLTQMPIRRIVLLVILGALAAHWFWPEFPIRHAEGVLAPNEPWQGPPPADNVWPHGRFTLTSLAEFEMTGRVLHTKRYMMGRESDISEYDVVLGWGIMSDQWLVDQLDFSQGRRWYFYKYQGPAPVAPTLMQQYSGNFHTITATDEIRDTIADLRPGHIIYLHGHLVRVVSPDGWYWESSLTRTDRGDGSCEIVWVDGIEVLEVEE
jgi:hypothetical protein